MEEDVFVCMCMCLSVKVATCHWLIVSLKTKERPKGLYLLARQRDQAGVQQVILIKVDGDGQAAR